jgi:anaerobic ribonucleoside-triphosphate reductase activating protein
MASRSGEPAGEDRKRASIIARVHAIEDRSRANGPGARFVIWFQGCSLGCPGCFNPATHPTAGGTTIAVDDLIARIAATRDIDGVSLSGGEPMQQPEAALAVVRGARGLGLSTLMFSGYSIDELRAMQLGPAMLDELDVLIDGRYVAGERLASGLRGSANQRIHVLRGRYTADDVEATPVAEIRIGRDGAAILTGVAPLKLK